MGQELVKALLVSVDGHEPEQGKIEDLDNYLTVGEFAQVQKVVMQLGGLDEESQPVPAFELVKTTGSK